MTQQKKRTKVEIYFILYLAALILILPDSKKSDDIEDGSTKIELKLVPERTVLNLRMLKKNGRNNIVRFDSVNKVFFDGQYDNIDFTYTISDVNRGETVEINELNNSKEQFQITENFQDKYINFRWNPDFNFDYNSTYLVKLTAFIEKGGKSKTSSIQFTLNTLFLNQVISPDIAENQYDTSNIDFNYFNTPISIPTNLSEMDAKISKNPIITFADNEWINYARIYNIASIDDLVGPPKITIKGDSLLGGTARFESSEGNYFTFSGMSPTYDTMKVIVKVRRKADDSEFSFDFMVIPSPRIAPDLPNVMYVGENYSLNTRLESSTSLDSYTIIKSGNTFEKRYNNSQFYFTPDASMLESNATLTRYVENKRLDSYTLTIKRKPRPVVEYIEVKDNRIIIKTKSFSLQRSKNYVETVKNNANLKFKDIIGKGYYDDGYQFQTFESDRLEKPISSIEIQLIEKNGHSSTKKTFTPR
jgi:hypothetical protein